MVLVEAEQLLTPKRAGELEEGGCRRLARNGARELEGRGVRKGGDGCRRVGWAWGGSVFHRGGDSY